MTENLLKNFILNWMIGQKDEWYVKEHNNQFISERSSIKLKNISDLEEIGKQYRLECVAIGYPKANVWWSRYSCPTPENCSPTHRNSDWIDIETDSNSSLLLLSNNEQILRPNLVLTQLNNFQFFAFHNNYYWALNSVVKWNDL